MDLLELEEQNLPKCNRALISVVSLALLCYIQNECSNLFQKIIGYYAFSVNIPKRSCCDVDKCNDGKYDIGM